MENKIEIFKSVDNETEIRVQIDVDSLDNPKSDG